MNRKSPAHWTIAQILEAYTDRSGGLDACWPWVRSTTRDKAGYGSFRKDGIRQLAHRAAWETANGLKLAGSDRVLHECDNTLCCNPKHLRRGTQADNIADMVGKGRRAPTRGAANPRANLSADQARAIFLDPRSDIDVHRRTGIPKPTINHIRKRRTWRDVTDGLPDVVRGDGRREGWHARRAKDGAHALALIEERGTR